VSGPAPAARRGLSRLRWPEVAARSGRSLLAVPVGSTEQHGPHLPLGTDTAVATALVATLARARPDVVAAPALPYGASGEHAGFAGTVSIGTDTLAAVLVELVRSADAFAGVVLVNAHGGNADACARALGCLHREGRWARAWSPPTPRAGDAHAGRTETSIMLALSPADVDEERAVAGVLTPLAQLMPALRAGGVAAISPSGVLGDPSGASAAEGRALLDSWGAALVADLADWPSRPDGGPGGTDGGPVGPVSSPGGTVSGPGGPVSSPGGTDGDPVGPVSR